MDRNETLRQAIINPREAYERTQALRELATSLNNAPTDKIPKSVYDFISTYETEDQIQATLTGIILFYLKKEQKADLGILARVFPGLFMSWEPAIREMSMVIFHTYSPKEVFEELTEMVGFGKGSVTDQYYAYNVISTVDFDRVKENLEESDH